jgi:DNA-binding XRE family transcriptional regulator
MAQLHKGTKSGCADGGETTSKATTEVPANRLERLAWEHKDMITDSPRSDGNCIPNSIQLALAVWVERVRSLPKEDRHDLYELSKLIFQDSSEEEVASAHRAMLEIIEQQATTVSRMQPIENPGADLEKWVGFVSEKIRTLRKSCSMTQEELAKRTGIPQSHISRLESGQHSPSFSTLEKIAKAFDIPVSSLDPSA